MQRMHFPPILTKNEGKRKENYEKEFCYGKEQPARTVSLLTVCGIGISCYAVELLEPPVHLRYGVPITDVGYDPADNHSGDTESDRQKQ